MILSCVYFFHLRRLGDDKKLGTIRMHLTLSMIFVVFLDLENVGIMYSKNVALHIAYVVSTYEL